MSLNLSARMAEITRLTRAGRLAEAMALLQGLPPESEPAEVSERLGRTPMRTILLDRLRDTMFTRSSSANYQPVNVGTKRDDPAGLPNLARSSVPVELRAFLARFGKLGSSPSIAGLVGQLPEPAPPPVPDGALFDEHIYTNQAGSRSYKLYVPTRSTTSEPLALMVMLHGCKQSPNDFALGTRMNELAEEYGFLVAYPRQSSSANPSRCWNWFNEIDQVRDRGEPSLIAGITQQIMRDVDVDPSRVYIAGLSAGGAATAIMGAAYPDLFAAICVHSGLASGAAKDVPSAFAAMRQGGLSFGKRLSHPLPTIVFHGDRDKIVSPVNGDQVIAQSRPAAELQVTVSHGRSAGGINYTRAVYAQENEPAILEQWVLHGTGHAWSGGSPAGSYTDPRGPDASREMVRFFLEHPRRVAK